METTRVSSSLSTETTQQPAQDHENEIKVFLKFRYGGYGALFSRSFSTFAHHRDVTLRSDFPGAYWLSISVPRERSSNTIYRVDLEGGPEVKEKIKGWVEDA
jgi:hypothetical protein